MNLQRRLKLRGVIRCISPRRLSNSCHRKHMLSSRNNSLNTRDFLFRLEPFGNSPPKWLLMYWDTLGKLIKKELIIMLITKVATILERAELKNHMRLNFGVGRESLI